jgi:hypothetical protein
MDANRDHNRDRKNPNEHPDSGDDQCDQGACSHHQADSACREISGELVDMVQWLSEGDLTPDQFRHTVADLETRKLQRFGFRLISAVGENGLVHFSLRFAKTDDLCASLDVDPQTGELSIQHTCS